MNAERRKQLQKAVDLLSEARGIIEQARDDEREACDSVSDQFPGTERAEKLEESASALDDVVTSFDEIESGIETAME